MIGLSQFSNKLEETLNDALTSAQGTNDDINSYIPNTSFVFRIFTSAGEYEKATVDGNNVTYYINGILREIGADKDGTVYENFTADISTILDMLVPMCDTYITLEDGEKYYLYDAVKSIIDNALTYNSTETITDVNETYFLASRFSISSVGIRDIRGQVGDSLPISVAIDYAIVAGGISSDAVEFHIQYKDKSDWERIYPKSFGLARSSIQEDAISSDSTSGISKSNTSGSKLVLTFALDVKYSVLYEYLIDYIIYGANTPFKIYIKFPGKYNNPKSKTYNMVFADSGINGLAGAAMSTDFHLVEELEPEGE